VRVLLTGFAPFDGDTSNPSAEVVGALADAPPPGLLLATTVLPVSYAGALPALRAAILRCAPDVVLATGLAGGRPHISVERIAINIDDARIADNDGARRVDSPVIQGGPAAYFATVPIKAIAAAIRAAGIPALVSQSAGTFLCNHIFYHACHIAATTRPGMRVGFLHLPFLPEQACDRAEAPGTAPSMALATQHAGLRAALAALRDTTADLAVAEGATN
jgi:pyroglutamyl-peptidase